MNKIKINFMFMTLFSIVLYSASPLFFLGPRCGQHILNTNLCGGSLCVGCRLPTRLAPVCPWSNGLSLDYRRQGSIVY